MPGDTNRIVVTELWRLLGDHCQRIHFLHYCRPIRFSQKSAEYALNLPFADGRSSPIRIQSGVFDRQASSIINTINGFTGEVGRPERA